MKALDAAVEAADRADVSAETSSPAQDSPTPGERPPLSVRRADALARIAESFLAHGAEVSCVGDRHQIVVHVDAQTLREGCAGRCEHEDGPALPVETVRRIGCDTASGPLAEDVHQGDWTRLFEAHDAMDIVITPSTAVSRWSGESMDYGTATDALLFRARRPGRNRDLRLSPLCRPAGLHY